MNEYLIKTLKEGRLKKGLKQSDVAKIVGVKANTLSNYENGVSEPDIDTFANLCEIYGLDFSYVLGEAYGLGVSGTDFNLKPSEIDLLDMYRALDDHGKEMVDFTLKKEWERSTKPIEGQIMLSASDDHDLDIVKNGKIVPYGNLKISTLQDSQNDPTDKTVELENVDPPISHNISKKPSIMDTFLNMNFSNELKASRNDFINDPGELEKTERDIKNLKRPD